MPSSRLVSRSQGSKSRSVAALFFLAVGGFAGALSGAVESSVTHLATAPRPPHAPEGAADGVVVENFPNSWHISVLGLDVDPASGNLLYAHEGFSSDPATIWDVDSQPPHAPLGSINLSVTNPGWPVTLNDRDGVAFDPVTGTSFLPDFQGDLANRDDNLVEIDSSGVIVNAWELDGAGNDSSDASAIPFVLDIAIVPGTPNRYFVTALDGTGAIVEIALTRSGLFVNATWSTVGSCIVPGISDSSGIDYDAATGRLYVSDFNSETVVVTDLACNVLETFVCDGPGTFHSGLAHVPGSNPPEVWLTDFTSESTSRCQLGEAESVLAVPALSTVGFAAFGAALAALAALRLRRRKAHVG